MYFTFLTIFHEIHMGCNRVVRFKLLFITFNLQFKDCIFKDLTLKPKYKDLILCESMMALQHSIRDNACTLPYHSLCHTLKVYQTSKDPLLFHQQLHMYIAIFYQLHDLSIKEISSLYLRYGACKKSLTNWFIKFKVVRKLKITSFILPFWHNSACNQHTKEEFERFDQDI